MGMTLASIHSQEELDLIQMMGSGWIGLHDQAAEGFFEWTDGSDLDYTNWRCYEDGHCEPNGGHATGEDCVHTYGDGSWNDRPCQDTNGAGRGSFCRYPQGTGQRRESGAELVQNPLLVKQAEPSHSATFTRSEGGYLRDNWMTHNAILETPTTAGGRGDVLHLQSNPDDGVLSDLWQQVPTEAGRVYTAAYEVFVPPGQMTDCTQSGAGCWSNGGLDVHDGSQCRQANYDNIDTVTSGNSGADLTHASCIRVNMDYGGGCNSCGTHADTLKIYTDSRDWKNNHAEAEVGGWFNTEQPPRSVQNDVIVDPTLQSALDCQRICNGIDGCDYFSYEFEIGDVDEVNPNSQYYHECYIKSALPQECSDVPYCPWSTNAQNSEGISASGPKTCDGDNNACFSAHSGNLFLAPTKENQWLTLSGTFVARGPVSVVRIHTEGESSVYIKRVSVRPFRHDYVYVVEAMTHDDAQANCETMGMQLASIHSQAENDNILAMGSGWIGLSDSNTEHTWQWSDGTNLDFQRWMLGRPSEGAMGRVFDCAVITTAGQWSDTACTVPRPSICGPIASGTGAARDGADLVSLRTFVPECVHRHVCRYNEFWEGTCNGMCNSECAQSHSYAVDDTAETPPRFTAGPETNCWPDDAEEDVRDGTMYIESSDLEIMDDGNEQIIGMLFRDIQLEPGVMVATAMLEFRVDEVHRAGGDHYNAGKSDLPVMAVIYGEKNVEPADISYSLFDLTDRVYTDAAVIWQPPTSEDSEWGTIGNVVYSPNIATVVQEIIDLDGWQAGNSMMILMGHMVGAGSRWVEAGQAETPALIYEYYPERHVVPLREPDAESIRRTHRHVLHECVHRAREDCMPDDAEEDANTGTMYVESSDLELMDGDGREQVIGIRFVNIPIPQMASITDARIEFEIDEVHDETPNPDHPGWEVYPPYEWNIECTSGPITVQVTELNLEETEWEGSGPGEMHACCDYVRMYDTGSMRTRAELSGMTPPAEVIESDGKTLRVRLTSDGGTQGTGFRAIASCPIGDPLALAPRTEGDFSAAGGQRLIGGGQLDSTLNPNGDPGYGSNLGRHGSHERVSIAIYGEYAPDSAYIDFTNGELSKRKPTKTAVQWTPPTTEEDMTWGTIGHHVVTPNIASILGEIVSHPAWKSGNSLMILFGHISGNGVRWVESSSGGTPALSYRFTGYKHEVHIDQLHGDAEEDVGDGSMYIDSSDLELMNDGNEQIIGMRFSSVSIPQGSVVTDPTFLRFQIDQEESYLEGKSNEPVTLMIYAEHKDVSDPITSTNFDLSNRRPTSAGVMWPLPLASDQTACETTPQSAQFGPGMCTDPEALAGDYGCWGVQHCIVQSPSIASVVNEVVNRPGWQFGNPLMIMMAHISGTGVRWVDSFGQGGQNTPSLTYTYVDRHVQLEQLNRAHTRSGSVSIHSCVHTAGCEFQDAEEDVYHGTMYLDSSDLELMHDGWQGGNLETSGEQIVAMRFTEVPIPNSAAIAEARITFLVDEVHESSSLPVTIAIFGELSDGGTSLPITTDAFDLSNRVPTTSTVVWRPVVHEQLGTQSCTVVGNGGDLWMMDAGDRACYLVTPDISTVVQEIVNQPLWEHGNALMILMAHVSGNGVRWVESGQQETPALNFEYY